MEKDVFMTKINTIYGTSVEDSTKTASSITLTTKKRIAHVILGAVFVATSGLVLQTSMPVFASHKNVGDGECSWFPDSLPGVYNFHEACTNHDACGARAGSNQQAWDRCDTKLFTDAKKWCTTNRSRFNPLRYSCLDYAAKMYYGLRAFVNLTGIHRD